jgi:nucleoside phosphorylase
MSNKRPRPVSRDCFEIAIICALPLERIAIEALLDDEYETNGFSYGKAKGDLNTYTIGRLGNQDVVLAYMPGLGMVSTAAMAAHIGPSFRNIEVGFLVGICGGVPKTNAGVEILLGDVIISMSVIQTDFGRQYPNEVIRKEVEDTLGRAKPEIREFGGKISGYPVRQRLQEKTHLYATQISVKDGFSSSAYPGAESDRLHPADHRHKHWRKAPMHEGCICDSCRSQEDDVCEAALQSNCEDLGCDDCLSMEGSRIQRARGFAPDGSEISTAEMQEAQKPLLHFGRIECSNTVIKSGLHRDRIAAQDGVIGFEMESAGTWDYLPTVVIKSVCDYADSHKDKRWQRYAAATAAACTKAVIEEWIGINAKMVKLANLDIRHVRPKAPLIIPFRRNEDFVEREALCDQINEQCSAPGSRTALVGLGGVG